MSLQGLVVDVSGTLLGPDGPHDGIDDLWNLCRAHQIKIIAASNRPADVERLVRAGYSVDFKAVPASVTARGEQIVRKPSPKFVTVPAQRLGLAISQMVYLGDSERTDAYCAEHARIPFLRADWAANSTRYGIGLPTLRSATTFLETFLLKDNPWFWAADGTDSCGRAYAYRALLDCRDDYGARSEVRDLAKAVLKRESPQFRDFFLYHLLMSLHLSGSTQGIDLWTTYPGHDLGSTGHAVIQRFLVANSSQFHDTALPLFVRHAQAASSRSVRNQSRAQGSVTETPKFATQVATCHLSPTYKGRVAGKNILVVDDFTTSAYSFELARNLLFAAGANRVLCVAIGKFGADFVTVAPSKPRQRMGYTFRSYIWQMHVRPARGFAAPGWGATHGVRSCCWPCSAGLLVGCPSLLAQPAHAVSSGISVVLPSPPLHLLLVEGTVARCRPRVAQLGDGVLAGGKLAGIGDLALLEGAHIRAHLNGLLRH